MYTADMYLAELKEVAVTTSFQHRYPEIVGRFSTITTRNIKGNPLYAIKLAVTAMSDRLIVRDVVLSSDIQEPYKSRILNTLLFANIL